MPQIARHGNLPQLHADPPRALPPVYDPDRPARCCATTCPRPGIISRADPGQGRHPRGVPIFEALPWKGLQAAAEAFLGSERGQAIRASEPFLPDAARRSRRAAPNAAPGSLAHAYCDFMEREGLTAQGLVEEFEQFAAGTPAVRRSVPVVLRTVCATRMICSTSSTGYGRDALGEQCVLAFTYGQQPSPAHLFLGYMGGWELKKRVKSGGARFSARCARASGSARPARGWSKCRFVSCCRCRWTKRGGG